MINSTERSRMKYSWNNVSWCRVPVQNLGPRLISWLMRARAPRRMESREWGRPRRGFPDWWLTGPFERWLTDGKLHFQISSVFISVVLVHAKRSLAAPAVHMSCFHSGKGRKTIPYLSTLKENQSCHKWEVWISLNCGNFHHFISGHAGGFLSAQDCGNPSCRERIGSIIELG